MALWNKEIVINAPIRAILDGFTAGITTTQNDEIITIASASEVKEYFNRIYHDFAMPYYTQSDLTSLDPIESKLSDTWSYYLNTMQANIDRVYLAYTTEYSPIDNYDKHSTITTEMSGTESDTSSGTTNYGATNSATTEKVSPDTSTSFYDTNSGTSSTEAYTDTNSATNTKSFNNRKDTVDEYTHGNIGVAETSQIVSNEIKMRTLRYIQWICDDFAMNYFIAMNDDDIRER